MMLAGRARPLPVEADIHLSRAADALGQKRSAYVSRFDLAGPCFVRNSGTGRILCVDGGSALVCRSVLLLLSAFICAVSVLGATASPARADGRNIVIAQADISEKDAYDAAKELGTIEAWEAFLNNFNEGFRADLARAYLRKIGTEAPPPRRSQAEVAAPPQPAAPADISLAVTSEGACSGGQDCTYIVTATNSGGEPYTGALTIATSVAPGGALLQGTGTPPYSCQDMGGGAVCSHGAANIGPGQTARIPLVFTLPRNAGGQVTACASIAWGGVPAILGPIEVQRKLNELGYDAGKVDGRPGRKTVKAIRAYQASAGLQQTGEMDLPLLLSLFAHPGEGDLNPDNDQACAGAAVVSAPATFTPEPKIQYCGGGRIRDRSGECACPTTYPVWTGKTCIPRRTRNCTGGRYYSKTRKLCLCPRRKPHWYNNRCYKGVDDCPGDSSRVGSKCIKQDEPDVQAGGASPQVGCRTGQILIGNNCVSLNLAPLFNIGKKPKKSGQGGGQPPKQKAAPAKTGIGKPAFTNKPSATGGQPPKQKATPPPVIKQVTPRPVVKSLSKAQIRAELHNHCMTLKGASNAECSKGLTTSVNKIWALKKSERAGWLAFSKAEMSGQAKAKQQKPVKKQIICKAGTGLIVQNGKCACPGNKRWNGSICAATGIKCAPDQKPQGNRCVPRCGIGTRWNGSTCIKDQSKTTTKEIICSSNLVPVNGQCKCPPGLTWNGKICAAPRKKIQKRAAPKLTVICQGGGQKVGNSCKCPHGQKVVLAATERNKDGSVRNLYLCQGAKPPPQVQKQVNCRGGQVASQNGTCVCPANRPRWTGSKCKKKSTKDKVKEFLKKLQKPKQQQPPPQQQPQNQPQQNQPQQKKQNGLTPQQQQQLQKGLKGLEDLFSDVRLKQNVVHLTTLKSGIKIYSFRYLWETTVRVGVMAQDLLADPAWRGAVSLHTSGFYRVDYGKLGLRMVALEEWEALGLASVQLNSAHGHFSQIPVGYTQ